MKKAAPDLWVDRGALELGGGGVQDYEKAHLGWFFNLRQCPLSAFTVGFLWCLGCTAPSAEDLGDGPAVVGVSSGSVPPAVILHPRDRSVSPSGSPNPWAAVPVFGFLVGAEGPGAGVVTVVRELVEHQKFESDGLVVAEHVPIDAQPQQFEQPGDPLP
ncbi:hypothetical protein Taro_012624 [Colocasia esculenta]|uniref:Uncharacterized protein n=1 Tax=Colocasia esculenta TaxID=4460 RepID=A0A843U9A3_COLES|nr:hypothetical protein [Colocasia esculenta]